MSKVQVYNQEGKAMNEMELNEKVFHVESKPSVVHQVYNAILANARLPWADTQGRGEVRGGGKKPWKQKGTGRARHGSIRSPIWKGGGVTFGPLSTRTYVQKINKKMNVAAVRMCFSDKVLENRFAVVEAFPTDGKTKSFAKLRAALSGHRSTLIITEAKDEAVMKSAANVNKVDVMRASDVSVVDLLHHHTVVATEAAIRVLEKRLK